MFADCSDHHSPEPLTGQEILLAKRAELGITAQQRPLPDGRLPGAPQQDFTLTNANQLLDRYRRRDQVDYRSSLILEAARADLQSKPLKTNENKSHLPVTTVAQVNANEGVKHYPSLGVAALEQKLTGCYQIWLIALHLESEQDGKLHLPRLRQFVSEKLGWSDRHLRRILAQGEGQFWKRGSSNRLFRIGAKSLAVSLGTARVDGYPIILPSSVLTAGRGDFNAHLFAAFHSGRRKSKPISQEKIEDKTGISERTQRHYCQKARVRRIPVYSIGERVNKQNQQDKLQDELWNRGRSCFVFIDRAGRHGQPGKQYISWRLPNMYGRIHEQAARGRVKKINSYLNLVRSRGGAISERVNKIFHDNGALAAKAYGQDSSRDHYWPASNSTSRRFRFMYCLPGQL